MKTHESGKAREKDNEKEKKKKISSQKQAVSKGGFQKKARNFSEARQERRSMKE